MEVTTLSESNTSEKSTNQAQIKVKKFSYFEPILGIIIAILFVVLFLGFPQIMTVTFSGSLSDDIPTWNVDVLRSLWIPIVLWGIFRVGVDVAYLIIRRYTKRLTIISLVGYALTAIVTLIIFIPVRIVNAEYSDFIKTFFAESAAWFGNILANPHIIIIVVMMIVLVLETINVLLRSKKEKVKENADDEKTEAVNTNEAV